MAAKGVEWKDDVDFELYPSSVFICFKDQDSEIWHDWFPYQIKIMLKILNAVYVDKIDSTWILSA
ncbi:unnamed protein product [Penicillium pancosmium]